MEHGAFLVKGEGGVFPSSGLFSFSYRCHFFIFFLLCFCFAVIQRFFQFLASYFFWSGAIFWFWGMLHSPFFFFERELFDKNYR